jgi:hypothetical protein
MTWNAILAPAEPFRRLSTQLREKGQFYLDADVGRITFETESRIFSGKLG